MYSTFKSSILLAAFAAVVAMTVLPGAQAATTYTYHGNTAAWCRFVDNGSRAFEGCVQTGSGTSGSDFWQEYSCDFDVCQACAANGGTPGNC
ncbi:uncharacterized protein PSFLO_03597 [Pseudozyma flocculosa]|uniref:Uncharacterized protein n=1 Tax=Pseudozyma flocculosa TaxID=84751 RepID=A0A5C3F228_9BASI|nr:uncharacterized protein PSFLO_03597 [Pseudozyma flocculosa]